MKKVFRLNNLECANCAAKMEAEIGKLQGVIRATVSFMTQRLTIECEDGAMEEIISKAQQIIRKIEPDCSIVK